MRNRIGMSESERIQLNNDLVEALERVLPPEMVPRASVRAHALLARNDITPHRALDVLATILRDAGVETELVRIDGDMVPAGFMVDAQYHLRYVDAGAPEARQALDERILVVRGRVTSFLTRAAQPPAIRSAMTRTNGTDTVASFRDVWPFLRAILMEERSNILVVIGYSIVSSLLALVVPITAQAVVNAVALGVFNKQLLVLCALVFLGLLASGVVGVLERWVIDLIQRRIFVFTSFAFIQRLPALRLAALREQYAPELVNRFFDVITIQKSVGKILLEGINAILVLTVGLVVLGFYHPFFLLYDAILVAFLPFIVYVLGRGGIGAAMRVSKRKYAVAAWLEEVARAHLAVKLTGARSFVYDTLDTIASTYVEDRRRHFVILARQMFGSMFFKSVATVGVLGLGGILVIDQQMSLGQLVAAEIVIVMMLNAVEKLIGQLDLYYDLVAAVDKVSSVMNKPLEDVGGVLVPASTTGGSIEMRDVWFTYEGAAQPTLRGASLLVPSGGRISLVGNSGSGKTTLLHMLLGLERPDRGMILVNGVEVRSADLTSLRARFGLVSPIDQLVDGTIEENVVLGRPISHTDVQWALRMACLHDDIMALPDGLATELRADGLTISFGMQRRILFARMIVHRPEILLLDEAFDGIENATKHRMLEAILAYPSWTIVNVSHDGDVVRSTDTIYLMHDGRITPPEDKADA
ncbi:MAG: ATP-binding cassette domain-containing protein ['Candidatus Kapabacteria' thiocyanatum]|uniref:ABC transporter n=1 Tax=Candidatus Kapaibacterium thiocyanatum TaxID=1895771 RepID=A0A1M3KV07_9BACT|nr:ATP-binding cassette domain-containing protein ['Candidatus Kapabacteria' thiocyanatum]OJX56243.1 MAG: hypothetical protein BGO89_12955 ['Candidatus Kapabacteria' thiocyanatum]